MKTVIQYLDSNDVLLTLNTFPYGIFLEIGDRIDGTIDVYVVEEKSFNYISKKLTILARRIL